MASTTLSRVSIASSQWRRAFERLRKEGGIELHAVADRTGLPLDWLKEIADGPRIPTFAECRPLFDGLLRINPTYTWLCWPDGAPF